MIDSLSSNRLPPSRTRYLLPQQKGRTTSTTTATTGTTTTDTTAAATTTTTFTTTTTTTTVLACGTGKAQAALEVDLGGAKKITAVMTREDLSGGQRVAAYEVDWFDGAAWHTAPALSSKGDVGVHGQSVGARMIDFLAGAGGSTSVAASKIRFRCTKSLAPDGSAAISSFSAHYGVRPGT